ncbi:MAG TPA: SpoIIE family protein phosphatase [Chthoniobacteraceae bacterium]|jgi:serine phosphatase RsbU (regulator of sigma subunit)/FixJ family two-component response regulator|nr:SpoIIE family protein phosphatase [Chthoniobacteraceae bacterium]
MPANNKLLIVDDEPLQMGALRDTLTGEGFEVAGYTSASAALQALREEEFDVVLTDLMMPDMDGIAFLRQALVIDPNVVGIVMTGHGAIDTAVSAMKAGALDYILKPFKLSAVIPVLARALAVRRLRMENIQLRETLGIYELSTAIASASGFDMVLEKLADAAFQESDGGEAVVLLCTPDESEISVAAARGANVASLLDRRFPVAGDVAAWLARFQRTAGSWNNPGFAYEHPFRSLTSGIALPMLAGGKLVGALVFTSSRRHRGITPGQLKTLNVLAGSAATALARAQLVDELEQRVTERTAELRAKNRQMEEELTMARELQIAMLPHRFPSVPHDVPQAQSAVRFYSVYRPAGSVSGDFFDVFPLPDNNVGVFIGDVMGHGVRAALVTAMLRALVQELSATLLDPGALLEEVNRSLKAILGQSDMVIFATATYLVVNAEGSRFLYANAGHPAPIHLRRNRGEAGPICHNGDTGPALGLFEETRYKTREASLSAGDCIILFTDGLFEVEAANEELYTEQRLRDSIIQKVKLPAEELLDGLLAEAGQFAGQENFVDDICMLAVEVSRVEPAFAGAN